MIESIIEWSIRNRFIVILASLVLGVAGVRAMLTMPVDAIPDRIVIDLDGLEVGDSVHVETIAMPEGVSAILGSRDSTVASIAASSAVREEALAAAQTAATAPEEGAEGEEAAAAPAAPAAEA